VVVEKSAVLLLDSSSSMAVHLDAVKDGVCKMMETHPPKLKQ